MPAALKKKKKKKVIQGNKANNLKTYLTKLRKKFEKVLKLYMKKCINSTHRSLNDGPICF